MSGVSSSPSVPPLLRRHDRPGTDPVDALQYNSEARLVKNAPR